MARNNTLQGFIVQNAPSNLVFAENFSVANGNAGFDIRGTTNCAIIGNVASGAVAGAGFILQDDSGTHNTLGVLSNNVSDGNSNEGIILLNCTGFVISGNFSSGNHGSGGLDLRGVQYSSITGNTIMNNNGAGITLEDNSAVYCLYNLVESNVSSDSQGSPTQTWGIQELGNSNTNRIIGNACRNNTNAAQMKVIGAATVSRFNTGFVTEAHGSATVAAGGTSIVVTHGLALTPALEQISVTPQGSLLAAAKFWVSTPTSTQFTINVDGAPGGAGIVFGWKCDTGY
jgi:nitrous oxidase accessory protein NosD